MTRHDILPTLAQFIGLFPLPGVAQTAPATRRLIQQCHLAGFQHHEGETLWPYLTVGDRLELRREPGNAHDHDAIRIDWNGRKLGYIPRVQNRTTARLIDQGTWLEARIGRLDKRDNPWQRLEVEIWMVG